MNSSPKDTSDRRELDVAVLGATGFTGRLVAEYLAADYPNLRIGLAGRSPDKLQALAQELAADHPGVADWPLITVDTCDPDSVAELASRTTAVATTVGPYTRFGLPVVAACAEAGTHYADLSGEVLFMRDSIDAYNDVASATGARIVHSCGFDSIPSDLGVYVLNAAVHADGEGDLGRTRLVVTRMKGGISGGTIASGLATSEDAAADPQRRATLADPYSLSPDRDAEPDHGKESGLRTIAYDDRLDTWVAPFVMASINTRVVRRSNALLDYAYGRSFTYSEVLGTGSGPAGKARATVVATGTGFADATQAVGPVRSATKKLLPKPGSGPSERTRKEGFFVIAIHTETTTGARYTAHVRAQGDPGYGATAMMLGESVVCLATEGDSLPPTAGVLTPATAMGDVLVDRLRSAGMEFRVERES